MPTSRFRTGPITACPCFFQVVPRPVFIRALVAHCTADHSDGHPIRTDHLHDGSRFHIETAADRETTTIRLEGP